jgi:hypothetical protein
MLAEKEVVRAEVHARWVSGGWGDLETPAQRAERHALSARWHELRDRLRRNPS